ncbi:MAG: hypothetical protein PHN31_01135 [Candidatus Gracilibacteria bacterium]|nr:hypothetical protein [Candidatus Gracilibacteria bacterium]
MALDCFRMNNTGGKKNQNAPSNKGDEVKYVVYKIGGKLLKSLDGTPPSQTNRRLSVKG